MHADGRHEFTRRMHVIALRIQDERACTADNVARKWTALCRVMLVQSGPGTQIVPAEIGRQAKDISGPLALRRTRLEHGVIDADVLAAGIQSAKRRREFASAESGGN